MILALALAFIAPGPQDEKAGLDACLAAAANDPDYSECYGAEIARSDKRLNAVWNDVMARLGGRSSPAGAALVDEQRAWIAFKEKACSFYWIDGFGSMHRTLTGPSCILGVINSRVEQLTAINDQLIVERE